MDAATENTKAVKVLSTKKLTLAQQSLLLNAEMRLVMYDAIKIRSVNAEVSANDFLIITSKNAIPAVREVLSSAKQVFCVGIKTEQLLRENGVKQVVSKSNAAELAMYIVDHHKEKSFTFYCGALRRNELPERLQKHDVRLKEVVVYDTVLTEAVVKGSFDAILFFSPSAVKSYLAVNSMNDAVAFCIGATTASVFNNENSVVRIANQPTIESTIVKAVKHFKKVL